MSQSLASILIHLIFSTKMRRPLIPQEITHDLHSYIGGIARAHGSHVLEMGGIEDHVHILLSLPRTMSLSDVIEEIKKSSSRWIKEKGSPFRDFAWQNGYGAFSIGQSNVDALRHYIQNQRVHHQTMSFQDEYRLFLKKYAIAFDERYVWD
jgi:putative transposase